MKELSPDEIRALHTDMSRYLYIRPVSQELMGDLLEEYVLTRCHGFHDVFRFEDNTYTECFACEWRDLADELGYEYSERPDHPWEPRRTYEQLDPPVRHTKPALTSLEEGLAEFDRLFAGRIGVEK